MKLAVVDGAKIKCEAGSKGSTELKVTTPFTPSYGGGKPIATILDNKPGDNVKPFGQCKLTGKRCVPKTPVPWIFGEPNVPLVSSALPILTEASVLMCDEGGDIKVVDPGQADAWVHASYNLSAEQIDALTEFLRGLGIGEKLAWAFATGGVEDMFDMALGYVDEADGTGKKILKGLKKAAKAFGSAFDVLAVEEAIRKGNYRDAAQKIIGMGATGLCGAITAPSEVVAPGAAAVACTGVGELAEKASKPFVDDAADGAKGFRDWMRRKYTEAWRSVRF